MSDSTLDRLISKGLVDAYACHKACGEYWTQCECHEVWIEKQGGLEALMQGEESDKREYLDNPVGHCVDCDDYHAVDLPCEDE